MKRQILMAESAGYCFGVRRAVKMVEDAVDAGGAVATLGPIIHNTQKVEELESRGVKTVTNPAEAGNGTLVVRAHGIPLELEAQANAEDIAIVDGTCPYVTNLQQQAKDLRDEGYKLVLLADPNHPETIGVMSYVDGEATVCKTLDELPRFGPKDRVAILPQTTQQKPIFSEAVKRIADQAYEVRGCNTICFETEDRQDAAVKLAQQVDAVVVVGGITSKNTEHLAKISREQGAKTVKVETADELDPEFFDGIERIGVTAGASTPDEQIQAVVHWLENIDNADARAFSA